jgi:hypothetical protein
MKPLKFRRSASAALYSSRFDIVVVVDHNLCGIDVSNNMAFQHTSVVCYAVQRGIESGRAGRAGTSSSWWNVVLVVETEISPAAERIHTANGWIDRHSATTCDSGS